MSSTNPIVVKSDTHVSFLPIPQNYNYLDPILRSVQVYDGPTIDSTHLGTYVVFCQNQFTFQHAIFSLYQAIASNNSLVSSGKYLTFYSLSWYYSVRNIVILQDYSGNLVKCSKNELFLIFRYSKLCFIPSVYLS